MSSGRDEMMERQQLEVAEERDFMGRPTKYKPEYCQKVIELGKNGKSFEQMASELDVGYRTLCNWRDAHDDFFHALEEAHILSMAWWESEAISYMVENKDGPRLNSSIWSRSMAARFPKKYRQEVKQEITGADGAALLSGLTVNFVKSDDTDESDN